MPEIDQSMTNPAAHRATYTAGVNESLDSFNDDSMMPKPISPRMHAALDYGVAAAFFGAGAIMMSRNRRAGTLAMINGAMVLMMSLFTDYPGGVWPRLSFKTHRTGDIGQALLAGLGPVMFGFAGEPEAAFFHGQAASEVGVIMATDWDAAP